MMIEGVKVHRAEWVTPGLDGGCYCCDKRTSVVIDVATGPNSANRIRLCQDHTAELLNSLGKATRSDLGH